VHICIRFKTKEKHEVFHRLGSLERFAFPSFNIFSLFSHGDSIRIKSDARGHYLFPYQSKATMWPLKSINNVVQLLVEIYMCHHFPSFTKYITFTVRQRTVTSQITHLDEKLQCHDPAYVDFM
jgi:hypothetical protein